LAFDRDVVAFYGDPAWIARMALGKQAYNQVLTEEKGVYTLEIKPNLGTKSFETVNNNGAQRGGRPIVQFIGKRVTNIEILEGQDLNPLIADDFVLIPRPERYDPNRSYHIKFRAKVL
jgi:zinc protease